MGWLGTKTEHTRGKEFCWCGKYVYLRKDGKLQKHKHADQTKKVKRR